MSVTIPTPETLLALVFAGIGIAFGRGFGKRLDQDIQNSEWFKHRSPITRNFLKRMLDVLHHWWMGGLLMVYYPDTPEFYWFGWGLFVDDLPDIPPRLLKFVENWKDYMKKQ